MDLDDFLPHPEHVTRQARVIDARRSVVWEELHSIRLRSLPVTLVLSGIRALPLLVAGKWRGGPDRTFLDVIPLPLLFSEAPSAVVFGGLLQPWRLAGGQQPPVLDAAGVREWSEPGWVKVGMEFRLTPAVGGTHLSCETRVSATDPATRRRFDRYWLVVGTGSSAIRWELLAAVAVRAEARSG